MRIYTKTGDAGETGLWGGHRVPKDHVRIEACGAIDELNALLGWVRSASPPHDIEAVLDRVQHELFALGAELASPAGTVPGTGRIDPEHIGRLEGDIDGFELRLPPLRHFILPGGVAAAAALHVARTACRRAERRVVQLGATPGEAVTESVLSYLNRLGDLLFVLARSANAAAGRPDVIWRGRGGEEPTGERP